MSGDASRFRPALEYRGNQGSHRGGRPSPQRPPPGGPPNPLGDGSIASPGGGPIRPSRGHPPRAPALGLGSASGEQRPHHRPQFVRHQRLHAWLLLQTDSQVVKQPDCARQRHLRSASSDERLRPIRICANCDGGHTAPRSENCRCVGATGLHAAEPRTALATPANEENDHSCIRRQGRGHDRRYVHFVSTRMSGRHRVGCVAHRSARAGGHRVLRQSGSWSPRGSVAVTSPSHASSASNWRMV